MTQKEYWHWWYEQNKLSRAVYNSAYRLTHKKEIANYNKNYYLTHRGKNVKKRKFNNFFKNLAFALDKLRKVVKL